jgi:hypothetical protein
LRLTGYKTTILRIGTNESDGIENIDYSYKVTKPGDFAGVAL